jgi:hypothetical protein
MRKFSDLERQIIKSILKINDEDMLNIISNIYSELDNKYKLTEKCYIKIENNDAIILLNENLLNIDTELLKSIEKKANNLIIVMIGLFDYLKNNNLIYLSKGLTVTGIGTQNNSEIVLNFIDSELKSSLINYTKFVIYPTETLRNLVNNNFLTDAELHQERVFKSTNNQIRWLIVSNVIACAALGVSFVNKEPEVQLSKDTIQSITTLLVNHDIYNKNNAINERLITNAKNSKFCNDLNQKIDFMYKKITNKNK